MGQRTLLVCGVTEHRRINVTLISIPASISDGMRNEREELGALLPKAGLQYSPICL